MSLVQEARERLMALLEQVSFVAAVVSEDTPNEILREIAHVTAVGLAEMVVKYNRDVRCNSVVPQLQPLALQLQQMSDAFRNALSTANTLWALAPIEEKTPALRQRLGLTDLTAREWLDIDREVARKAAREAARKEG